MIDGGGGGSGGGGGRSGMGGGLSPTPPVYHRTSPVPSQRNMHRFRSPLQVPRRCHPTLAVSLQQDVEHYKKCYTEEHGRANHMAALLHDALEELEGVKRERDDLQQNLLENVNLCGKERVEHRTVMARLQDTLSVMQSKAEATHSRKAELEGAVDTMNVTITGEREVTFRVLKEHQVRGERGRGEKV